MKSLGGNSLGGNSPGQNSPGGKPVGVNSAGTSDDKPGPRVTAVLESLAVQRASGMLEIEGNPAGIIYLDRGQITYAQASWVPDLAARFCASRQPPEDVRALLLGADQAAPDRPAPGQAGRDLGAMLLSCVTREELQDLLRSAIVDAILALTVPLSGDVAVSGIRFEAPRAHWASAFARLPLDSVREEAVCRAARIAPYQVSRTTTVALRDLDREAMVLTREEWAIASRIGRTATVRDLAWCSGLALCDTIECVGRLVRAGVCTLGPARSAAAGPAVGDGAEAAAGPAAGSAAAPVARPGAGAAAGPAARSAEGAVVGSAEGAVVGSAEGSAAGPAAGLAGASRRAAAAGQAQSTVGAQPAGAAPAMLPAPGGPEPLPRRQPGTHLAPQLRASAGEAQPGTGPAWPEGPAPASFTLPPPDVLHRLLKGLRNLR